jgi:hypothetical protein
MRCMLCWAHGRGILEAIGVTGSYSRAQLPPPALPVPFIYLLAIECERAWASFMGSLRHSVPPSHEHTTPLTPRLSLPPTPSQYTHTPHTYPHPR